MRRAAGVRRGRGSRAALAVAAAVWASLAPESLGISAGRGAQLPERPAQHLDDIASLGLWPSTPQPPPPPPGDSPESFRAAIDEAWGAGSDGGQQPTDLASHAGRPVTSVTGSALPPRPWEDRFEARPWAGDLAAAKTWPENRKGYKRFTESRPDHPLLPNHSDQEVEGTTMVLLIVAALGSVLFAGVLLTSLGQGKDASEEMRGFLLAIGAPWILPILWLLHVGIAHFREPVRAVNGVDYMDRAPEAWACRPLLWYIALAPMFAAFVSVSHFYHLFRVHAKRRDPLLEIPDLPENPAEDDDAQRVKRLAAIAERTRLELEYKAEHALERDDVRYGLTAVLALILLLGFWLTEYGRYTCHPEIWWGALSFTIVVSVLFAIGIPAIIVANWLSSEATAGMIAQIREAMQEQYGPAFKTGEDDPFAEECAMEGGSAQLPPSFSGKVFDGAPGTDAAEYPTVVMAPARSQAIVFGSVPGVAPQPQPVVRWVSSGALAQSPPMPGD